eukprot:778171-Amphidinium_carterae.2
MAVIVMETGNMSHAQATGSFQPQLCHYGNNTTILLLHTSDDRNHPSAFKRERMGTHMHCQHNPKSAFGQDVIPWTVRVKVELQSIGINIYSRIEV